MRRRRSPQEKQTVSHVQHPPNAELEKLNATGLELADLGQDIRGRKVIDPSGLEIGHVSNLFIDRGERKVRMVEIHSGGFLGLGGRHVLLPVDCIVSVTSDLVAIKEVRERVANSPAYDPDLIEEPTPDYWEPFYGYYGLAPFWGGGYLYPRFPQERDAPDANAAAHAH
jgi:sporulation protein YlmC with PRC-barrel domain